MEWIAVAVVVSGIAGYVYWRKLRRKRSRLISIVGLLRETAGFDPVVLARVAGKTWDADLGDGISQGPDGFVAGGGISSMIMCRGRPHLINSFPRPYVDDVEQFAEGIVDRRIAGLFREHTAWFSCDALGVDGATPEEEVGEWYRRLGKLTAELLDENCLLLLIPDTNRAYPINEETEAALRSESPLAALQETLTAPIVQIADDDPRMLEAVARARREWPAFVAAFEAGAGENFSVKAPITHADNTEFIWVSVTSLEGERIYGELGNDPADLGPLKLGSKVSLPVAELNDWCYIDPQGELSGGFTIEVLRDAARRKEEAG